MFTRPTPFTVPAAEQQWVDAVAGLAPQFAATVADDDAGARLPIEHLQALHATGLDAAFLPVEHGGDGLSYVTLVNIVRTLATVHPALATVWLMHIGAAHALVTLSSPEEGAFFAAELRAGKRFANALSEPAGGNLFLASQQDASPTAAGWALTGRKLFISGSEIADYFFLNSRVDGNPAFFGVTVDDTVSFPPIQETMGMRATRSRTVEFAETPLLASRLCGIPPIDYANLITVAFAFLSLGIAESALDLLTASAHTKKGPAPALADAQWVKMETGLLWTETQAVLLLAERVAWLADQRSTEAMAAATESKMLANELAKKAAAEAVRVGGGGSYLVTSPIQRVFRDAQAGALMAYSVPFSQEVIGNAVLEASAPA
ncbi:acyl-CoA dehydrogenase family protein [Microbacterium sediminicola]|uniref:Acyl-CoA dehydrogenase family protein n=1 Tax=Microbacterium sediminicola TaxID=415210 RepID=A0ABP4UJX5_9MICO